MGTASAAVSSDYPRTDQICVSDPGAIIESWMEDLVNNPLGNELPLYTYDTAYIIASLTHSSGTGDAFLDPVATFYFVDSTGQVLEDKLGTCNNGPPYQYCYYQGDFGSAVEPGIYTTEILISYSGGSCDAQVGPWYMYRYAYPGMDVNDQKGIFDSAIPTITQWVNAENPEITFKLTDYANALPGMMPADQCAWEIYEDPVAAPPIFVSSSCEFTHSLDYGTYHVLLIGTNSMMNPVGNPELTGGAIKLTVVPIEVEPYAFWNDGLSIVVYDRDDPDTWPKPGTPIWLDVLLNPVPGGTDVCTIFEEGEPCDYGTFNLPNRFRTGFYEYDTPGEKTITFVISELAPGDPNNKLTATFTIIVTYSDPFPEIELSSVSLCKTPIEYTFSLNPLGRVLTTCEWNFGDGTTKTGCTSQTKTYTTAGSYTVTVKMTDGLGTEHTSTKTITALSNTKDAKFWIEPFPPHNPTYHQGNALNLDVHSQAYILADLGSTGDHVPPPPPALPEFFFGDSNAGPATWNDDRGYEYWYYTQDFSNIAPGAYQTGVQIEDHNKNTCNIYSDLLFIYRPVWAEIQIQSGQKIDTNSAGDKVSTIWVNSQDELTPITFTLDEANRPADRMKADDCTWSIDGVEQPKPTPDSCVFTYEFPSEKRLYEITLSATNKAMAKADGGGPRDEGTLLVSIEPITSVITHSSTNPGEEIKFYATFHAEYPTSGALAAWDFGDGGTDGHHWDASHNRYTATHTYSEPGWQTVTLTLTDESDPNNKITVLHRMLIAEPIDIKSTVLSCKTIGSANPLVYEFSLTSASTISDCEWNFGDGDIRSGCDPKVKEYTEPRSYDVKVTGDRYGEKATISKVINPTEEHGIQAVYADFLFNDHWFNRDGRVSFSSKIIDNGENARKCTLDFGDETKQDCSSWLSEYKETILKTYTDTSIPYLVRLTLEISDSCQAISEQWIPGDLIVPSFDWEVWEAPIQAAQAGSIPITVQFKDTSKGGPIVKREWKIDGVPFGDGEPDPVLDINRAGTYKVTLTLNGNSRLSIEETIIFGSRQPWIIVEEKRTDFTEGETATFIGKSSDPTPIAEWTWRSNYAPISYCTTSQCPFTFREPGSYIIELITINADGESAISNPVTIMVYPDIGFDITVEPLASCTGFFPVQNQLTATSSRTEVSYMWLEPEDVLTKGINPIRYKFDDATPKTFKVVVKDQNGNTIGIYYHDVDPIGYTLGVWWNEPQKLTSETGQVIVTFNGYSDAAINHQDWVWYRDDQPLGFFGDTVHIPFTEAGEYKISLEATTRSCDTPQTQRVHYYITIEEELEAKFECAPLGSSSWPLLVTCDGTSSYGQPQLWEWTIDGTQVPGGSDGKLTRSFTGVGTYYVGLTVRKGNEMAFTSEYITLSERDPTGLNPRITASRTSGQVPLTVQFAGTETTGATPTKWEWSIDGILQPTMTGPGPHTYTFTDPNTYSVILTVYNEVDTPFPSEPTTIIATSGPSDLKPAFSAAPRSGQIPLTVRFDDETAGGRPERVQWYFGDGTNSGEIAYVSSIEHTYTEPGMYDVSYRVSNGERWYPAVTERQYITVGAAPTASFSHTTTVGRTPLRVQFTDTSSGPGINKWQWDFGNGQTSDLRNPHTTYNLPGEYFVRLTVFSEYGSDTTEPELLRIREDAGPVKASFRADPTVGQRPLWVQFTDTSTGEPDNWEWNFGDGSSTSDIQHPLHLFEKSGSYRVTLKAWRGAETPTMFSETIKVSQDGLPDVQFKAEAHIGDAPLVVCFVNDTNPEFAVTSWLWDFGDGSNSLQEKPCHTYRNPGLYTVTLEAKNAQGVGQIIKVAYVTVTEPTRNTRS